MKYDNEDQSSNYKVIRASCHNQLMNVSVFVIQHTTLLCFCYIKQTTIITIVDTAET